MSGVSWPKIGVIPAPLPEHATHLKHEASTLKEFANGKNDGKPKKTVQCSYIEPFIVSVMELTEQVLNQPGTAQIAADLGALVRRMDSVEQNTTITKNLLEAPVDRNLNLSATTGYRNTRLWAQVAAQAMPPPSAASFPSTFVAQSTQGTSVDLSMPDDRRVIVKLEPTLIDHFCTLTPRALRDRVTSYINASTDHISSTRVAAAKQLRSGYLAIYTRTVAEKEALQANPDWAKALGACKVVKTTNGVIVHGVPANSIQMDDQRQTIARIQAENHKIRADKDILISYVGWLCAPKRAAGSMVVEFADAEQANVALQTGQIWDSEYKKTELSEECPSKDLGKRKCASCGGPHRARDSKCPEYQKEAACVQMTRSTKQTRWRVLSADVQTPLSAPFNTPLAPTSTSILQSDAYTYTATPMNVNNPTTQSAPTLPTPTLRPTLNINGKRPASPTKTGSNRTPLGTINNNGRAKRTITKPLKQQSIDAEAERERSGRGEAINIGETPSLTKAASVSETNSEEVGNGTGERMEPENSAITDPIHNSMKSRNKVMASMLRDPQVTSTHHPCKDHFHLAYPTAVDPEFGPARICFFVNTRLKRAQWTFKEYLRDLATLDLQYMEQEQKKRLHIHNIYREAIRGDITETLDQLNSLFNEDPEGQHLVVGDFNLHHPTWGRVEIEGDREAEQLLTIIDERQLTLLLPQGSVTWRAHESQSTIDLALGTPSVTQRLVSCGVMKENHDSDHYLILTTLLLEAPEAMPITRRQWDKINMEDFKKVLDAQLPRPLTAQTEPGQMEQQIEEITKAIQHAIQETVPLARPSKWSKPGFGLEAKEIIQEVNRARRKWQRRQTIELWKEYSRLRNAKGKKLAKLMRRTHRERVEAAAADPKGLWKLAKWAKSRGVASQAFTPAL
ncbi:MAG: hypothetical protein FRX48_04733 [Lasallia pustulata]|uniref:Endonuclease/exonuclease/phosphatase domain-containing protein n=1 Tax=Lasallia pustulata TaxID=136370 RepID=A0A5M8PRY3_9LECA|nr:MAG: hypothetical protein FRX48_04733 [Lasallia pustulata]